MPNKPHKQSSNTNTELTRAWTAVIHAYSQLISTTQSPRKKHTKHISETMPDKETLTANIASLQNSLEKFAQYYHEMCAMKLKTTDVNLLRSYLVPLALKKDSNSGSERNEKLSIEEVEQALINATQLYHSVYAQEQTISNFPPPLPPEIKNVSIFWHSNLRQWVAVYFDESEKKLLSYVYNKDLQQWSHKQDFAQKYFNKQNYFSQLPNSSSRFTLAWIPSIISPEKIQEKKPECLLKSYYFSDQMDSPVHIHTYDLNQKTYDNCQNDSILQTLRKRRKTNEVILYKKNTKGEMLTFTFSLIMSDEISQKILGERYYSLIRITDKDGKKKELNERLSNFLETDINSRSMYNIKYSQHKKPYEENIVVRIDYTQEPPRFKLTQSKQNNTKKIKHLSAHPTIIQRFSPPQPALVLSSQGTDEFISFGENSASKQLSSVNSMRRENKDIATQPISVKKTKLRSTNSVFKPNLGLEEHSGLEKDSADKTVISLSLYDSSKNSTPFFSDSSESSVTNEAFDTSLPQKKQLSDSEENSSVTTLQPHTWIQAKKQEEASVSRVKMSRERTKSTPTPSSTTSVFKTKKRAHSDTSTKRTSQVIVQPNDDSNDLFLQSKSKRYQGSPIDSIEDSSETNQDDHGPSIDSVQDDHGSSIDSVEEPPKKNNEYPSKSLMPNDIDLQGLLASIKKSNQLLTALFSYVNLETHYKSILLHKDGQMKLQASNKSIIHLHQAYKTWSRLIESIKNNNAKQNSIISAIEEEIQKLYRNLMIFEDATNLKKEELSYFDAHPKNQQAPHFNKSIQINEVREHSSRHQNKSLPFYEEKERLFIKRKTIKNIKKFPKNEITILSYETYQLIVDALNQYRKNHGLNDAIYLSGDITIIAATISAAQQFGFKNIKIRPEDNNKIQLDDVELHKSSITNILINNKLIQEQSLLEKNKNEMLSINTIAGTGSMGFFKQPEPEIDSGYNQPLSPVVCPAIV